MIRVLHVIGAMNRAGAETFIMNCFRNIDRSKIMFDFLVHTNNDCDYDKEIRSLGGNIYRIPSYTGLNHFTYMNECRVFFENHPEIDVVHGHIGSSAPIYLNEAKKSGKKTIAHSHNFTPLNSVGSLIYKIISFPVIFHADYFMACSHEAAKDRFGKTIAKKDCLIINNGIDVSQYRRDMDSTIKAKSKLGLTTEPVFCHIGRFEEQKNHPFLIKVFKAIIATLPNSKLLLVGRGQGKAHIKELVKQYELCDNVEFLGVREDIPDILRASDVFLFPSLYEGLGIALIEAQAIGIPCLISDKVSSLSNLTKKVDVLSLADSNIWANRAISLYEDNLNNYEDAVSVIKEKRFDIKDTANFLEEFYSEMTRHR